MRDPGRDAPGTTFEDHVREWGLRPSRISAQSARERVVARLPEGRHGWSSFRLVAVAALLIVLAVAVWRGSPRPAGMAPRSLAAFVPSVDPNVVVWVVDSRTTVYFVLDKGVATERGTS